MFLHYTVLTCLLNICIPLISKPSPTLSLSLSLSLSPSLSLYLLFLSPSPCLTSLLLFLSPLLLPLRRQYQLWQISLCTDDKKVNNLEEILHKEQASRATMEVQLTRKLKEKDREITKMSMEV